MMSSIEPRCLADAVLLLLLLSSSHNPSYCSGGTFVGTLLVKALLVTPYGDIRLFNSSLPEHPAVALGNDSALTSFFQVRRISALGWNRKLANNGTVRFSATFLLPPNTSPRERREM